MTIADADIAALARYDTPTICNAIAAVAPEAMARRTTKTTLRCRRPDLPPIVGFARTALYRTIEPGILDKHAQKAQDIAYFDYVAAGDGPRIVLIQDADTPHVGTNALFGDVMSVIHTALGCVGLVTNGAVRDLSGMAENFQVLHHGVAPARGGFHRADFDCEVNVAGLYAHTNSLIHADENGAVVVPPDYISAILEEAESVSRKEEAVVSFCSDPGFTVDDFKRFWADR